MTRTPGLKFFAILLAALSLSIGWGVRGNWGHEFGAMIPGALAAMAVCLTSGRPDWRERVAYFAFFGALGWSFGGSMSYMQVVGYTHSGHFLSMAYGFACLFVIGFLWGAIGGAGTALPAVLDRQRLTELFPPIVVLFLLWWLQGIVPAVLLGGGIVAPSDLAWMKWNDTDWIAALLAVVAAGLMWVVAPQLRRACSLVLHMSVGWWVAFLGLVIVLGLRMTPPRGDNWAGMLGMTAGMLVYFWRQGLYSVVFASLATGFFAGLGFSGCNAAKLAGIATGIETNWHSLLEQSFGFVSGIGVALSMGLLSTRTPRLPDEPTVRRWTGLFAVGFTLVVITFLNIRKNVQAVWLLNKSVPESMYGIPIQWWFDAAYLAMAVVVLILILQHEHQPLAARSASWLGRGQLLYLVFLWWIVLGNLSRVLPFHPERLVTEGVIHVNACICTMLALLLPREEDSVELQPASDHRKLCAQAALVGFAGAVAAFALEIAVTRGIYGDSPAGFAGKNIRFGPNATTQSR